jgi:hypothetical protein
MIIQFVSLMICLVKNITVQIIFENFYFLVGVPNSEERKLNSRNPYLRVLVRIIESLYSGGGTPASRSASALTVSRMTMISVSGFESIISLIILK